MAKVAPRIKLPGFSPTMDAVLKGCTHFVLSGPIMIFLFLYGTAFLKSFNHEKAFSNYKNRVVKCLRTGMFFWPLANFIAYKYAPIHLLQPCRDIFAFCWSFVLSKFNNMKIAHKINSIWTKYSRFIINWNSIINPVHKIYYKLKVYN